MMSLERLPFFLGLLPVIVAVFGFLSQWRILDWIGPFVDYLWMVFFLPVMLFYDWIGFISFNVLGGTPTLKGSAWLATVVYVLSSSALLFILGKLILYFLTLFKFK